MASLTYWSNFSKRKNSTKQPTGGTSISVTLKENTSLVNPIFICSNVDNANYCQFQGRYYYINDIVFVTNDIREFHCSIDVLATYKANIVGASAFVKYYSHNNSEIVDSRLSTKTTATVQANTTDIGILSSGATTPTAIVSIVGRDNVSSYAMDVDSASVLTSRYDTWFTDELHGESADGSATSWWDDIDDPGTTTDKIAPTLFGFVGGLRAFLRLWRFIQAPQLIFNHIRSAHWLPISYSHSGNSIYIGQYATNQSGALIETPYISQTYSVAIPWQTNDWRRNAPYHQIYLYCPYIGMIQLSNSSIIGVTALSVKFSCNLLSGDCSFAITTSDGRAIGTYGCNIASPLPIGSSNINVGQAVSNTLSNGMSAVSGTVGSVRSALGGNIGGAISNGLGVMGGNVNTAIGICNDLTPSASCIGGVGGSALVGLGDYSIHCISIFHDTTVSPTNVSAISGTPYNGVMSIPSSGYVECVGASIDCGAYGEEKSMVNSYLNGGIYVE